MSQSNSFGALGGVATSAHWQPATPPSSAENVPERRTLGLDFPFAATSVIEGAFDDVSAPAITEPAEATVAHLRRWSYRAIGQRPIDWICRDALFSRVDRLKVAWPMRRLLRAQVFRNEIPFGSHNHKQWERVRSFHYLHLSQLYGLLRQLGTEESDDHAILARLLACPPVGALVGIPARRWVGGDVCRQSRLCPFCCSRTAGEVYCRCERILASLRTHKILFQCTCEICDNDLPEGYGNLSLQRRIQLVRPRMISEMRSLAERFGVIGGIQTFQITPALPQHLRWDSDDYEYLDQRGYHYVFGLLGSIECATSVLRRASADEQPLEIGLRCGNTDICGSTTVAIRPIDEPSALRALLVGTAATYTGDGGPIARGVLSHEPWLLANLMQWREHRTATKGMPVYQFFGTWRPTDTPFCQNTPPCPNS